MLKVDLLRPLMKHAPHAKRLGEQLDYLHGVLLSDPGFRMDAEADLTQIEAHGHGTPAFWRGLIEQAGSITLYDNGTGRTYPSLALKGSYPVLNCLLDFMEGEMAPTLSQIIAGTRVVGTRWDESGKLRHMTGGGLLRFTGVKAQDVCRVLYPPDSNIGLRTIRERIDAILMWTPRK